MLNSIKPANRQAVRLVRYTVRQVRDFQWITNYVTTRKLANRLVAELRESHAEHIELISEPCVLNSVCIYWDRDQQTGNYTKTDLS